MDQLTDTHAHIYSKQFDADRDGMIDRARAAGVGRIYMPNVDTGSIDRMLEAEQRYADCIPMMGLHPCSVGADFSSDLAVVESWLGKRPFAAIGEIGTDLYWEKTWWPQQQEAFRIQVEWSLQLGLPVVIHCRSSMDETIALLEPFRGRGLKGIFHCFSGTTEQMGRIIELGFHVGIGGVSTYKNGGLDKVLPGVDLSRIVLETDCPYLAPVPYRGKRNEPAYLPLIATRVAEILGIEVDEVTRRTTENALKLFGNPA